jgi:hypothetical protein
MTLEVQAIVWTLLEITDGKGCPSFCGVLYRQLVEAVYTLQSSVNCLDVQIKLVIFDDSTRLEPLQNAGFAQIVRRWYKPLGKVQTESQCAVGAI